MTFFYAVEEVCANPLWGNIYYCGHDRLEALEELKACRAEGLPVRISVEYWTDSNPNHQHKGIANDTWAQLFGSR